MLNPLNEIRQTPTELPFLAAICWQTDDVLHFTEDEMLNRYERGWNYRGVLEDLQGEELQFVRYLAQSKGSWLAANV
jgi:hypothetical protein